MLRPWEQFNGEAQRKQAGNAKEVSDPSTGSASGTQQDDNVEWNKAPTMKPVDIVAQKPDNGEAVSTGVMQPAERPNVDANNTFGSSESFTEYRDNNGITATEPLPQANTKSKARKPSTRKLGPDGIPELPTDVLAQYNRESREDEEYVREHPWVTESDLAGLYDKYASKTPSQMLYDISQYRTKHGDSLTEEEMATLLAGRDPNKSKKEEVREKRLAYWADALNQLGNVLAHFYNYGRAKGGSPAAQVPDNKSSYSERLRAADMAMRQRGYNDYVNALANAQKRKQTREDMEYRLRMQEAQEQRRLANQIALKEHEWLSPKYKLELERSGIDLSNKAEQLKLIKAKLAYQMMVNEGKSAEQALDISYKRLKNALANKKLNDGGSKTDSKFTVAGKGFNDPWQAYQYAISKGAKPVKIKKVDYVDGSEKEVPVSAKDFKSNDYSEWLDAVGVKTN